MGERANAKGTHANGVTAKGLGIIEGFFGPPWTPEFRRRLPRAARQAGLGYYFYAPKADPRLRRQWRVEWPASYITELSEMAARFRAEGIEFGVGLSPFGLGDRLEAEDASALVNRMRALRKVGIDRLGLFFDDMHAHPRLLETQLAALAVVRGETDAKIVFCPTYYTPDPILDRVFGARPDDYLSGLGARLSPEVDCAWTGPKVISREITAEHLAEWSAVLRRPLFLWDNVFANDGPKNCKFLRLRALVGRSADAFAASAGWALNPMNQGELSLVVMSAARQVLLEGAEPEAALEAAIAASTTPRLAKLIQTHRRDFDELGLDGLTTKLGEAGVAQLRAEFAARSGGADDNDTSAAIAREITDWLGGRYNVGSECLTD